MRIFTTKPHECVNQRARASLLALAILALFILFFGPAQTYAAGIEDFDYAYDWKLIDKVSGLPKSGDKDVFTDKDWYPVFMGVKKDSNRYYLAGLRSSNIADRFGQKYEIEGFKTTSNRNNAFPYEKSESTTMSDYGCLYIKYAGKNLNGKDVYYLKRDDGKILVNSINSDHRSFLIAVEPEDLKKPLNSQYANSTWDHYSCHTDCFYEGLHTWEFIREPGRTDQWAFSIHSGGCKYEGCYDQSTYDPATDTMIKNKIGRTTDGLYEESRYYFFWDDPHDSYVSFWITTQKAYFSIHMGSYRKINRIMQSMTIPAGQEYRLSSSKGYSMVAPEASITVAKGGTLLVENTVIWSGNISIQEGGTMVLYPGARVIMTANQNYEISDIMMLRGNLIIMKDAMFYYGGNRKDWFQVMGGNDGGSIYNNGVMLMGNAQCDFDRGAKLEVANQGEVIFGRSIKPQYEFGISLIDSEDQSYNIRMRTMFPEFMETLDQIMKNATHYVDSLMEGGEQARARLTLGEQVLIRNNGWVKFAECGLASPPDESAKWIGANRFTGSLAEGTLPESLFQSVQTWP